MNFKSNGSTDLVGFLAIEGTTSSAETFQRKFFFFVKTEPNQCPKFI